MWVGFYAHCQLRKGTYLVHSSKTSLKMENQAQEKRKTKQQDMLECEKQELFGGLHRSPLRGVIVLFKHV